MRGACQSGIDRALKIGIFGAGGVGGYFGAQLAANGTDVAFVARGAHLAALRADGISVESTAKPLTGIRVRAEADAAAIGPVDIAVLTVKLWDTDAAVAAMAPLVGSNTAVVSFQNGVVKDDILREAFVAERVIGGISYIEASIARPGVIAHGGVTARLAFGEFGGTRSERVEAFLTACTAAGVDATISDDIERTTWEKYVFLVGLSATTAATRAPIGVVRENADSRALLRSVMEEVVAVARTHGVAFDETYIDGRMAFVDTLPPGMNASMARDLERGNRLELPWLSGGVVAFGQSLGISTPMNRAIAGVLAPYAMGA